jgi:hypothetical protein
MKGPEEVDFFHRDEGDEDGTGKVRGSMCFKILIRKKKIKSNYHSTNQSIIIISIIIIFIIIFTNITNTQTYKNKSRKQL